MKNNMIFMLLMLAGIMSASAQILNVSSVERLDVPVDANGIVPQAVAVSPQGDYILLSTDTRQGLVKWDLTTNKATTLTTQAGAGSNVCISQDGQQVVYGEVSYKNKRRHEAVKTINLTSGKSQTLVKPTRDLRGYSAGNATATVVADGQVKSFTLAKGVPDGDNRPVLSRHHLKLYITQGGVTTQLAPNGSDEHYIWGSLSPDGSRVLYYVSGLGTFVCDIDGTHVTPMGNLTAPKWWDNNTIVGMDEEDGEYAITASRIVARTLEGEQQVLTGDDVIATYPLPSSLGGKIVFSTPDGQIYLITVN